MDKICVSCRKPNKATLLCGACEGTVCKNCAQFLENTTFAFEPKLSDELKHTYYCTSCHQEHVSPALSAYEETLQQARDIFIFFTTQKSRLPVKTKATQKIKVENCPDRDETILRIAFQAAQLGYNSVIETEVSSEKVRNAGWQKSNWKGAGLPANLDRSRLERMELYED